MSAPSYLRLTLRDLFWLVALVAMGCGWWVDRSRRLEQAWEVGAIDEQFRWLEAIDNAGADGQSIMREYAKLPGKGFYPLPSN